MSRVSLPAEIDRLFPFRGTFLPCESTLCRRDVCRKHWRNFQPRICFFWTRLLADLQSGNSSACAHPRRHRYSWHESRTGRSIPAKAPSCHQVAYRDHVNCPGPTHLLADDLVLVPASGGAKNYLQYLHLSKININGLNHRAGMN